MLKVDEKNADGRKTMSKTMTKWWDLTLDEKIMKYENTNMMKMDEKNKENDEKMKKDTIMKIGETHDETWLNKKTCDKVMKIEEKHDEMWQEQYQNYC